MAALLKDALKPNLVQTLEGTPALVHGGPFANIAHGCNSRHRHDARRSSSRDYVVTEAGFGADLGAEKFLDIKCRLAGLSPSRRRGRGHGARAQDATAAWPRTSWERENLEALEKGLPNLLQHVEQHPGRLRPAGASWPSTPSRRTPRPSSSSLRRSAPSWASTQCSPRHWAKGGAGAIDLARCRGRCLARCPAQMTYSYELEGTSIEDKLEAVAAQGLPRRRRRLRGERPGPAQGARTGAAASVICPCAWPRRSTRFSDDPALLGAPRDFRITVRNLTVSAGAGFIVALTGDIMTMPGLSKVPSAEKIDVDSDGKITGLF